MKYFINNMNQKLESNCSKINFCLTSILYCAPAAQTHCCTHYMYFINILWLSYNSPGKEKLDCFKKPNTNYLFKNSAYENICISFVYGFNSSAN